MRADAPERRSLRVLAIHRYYWPDSPPYASMLRAIVARWGADGHRVHVLSTQPSYKIGAGLACQPDEELLDGALVRRIDLPSEHGRPLTRLLNVARFAWAIVRQARRTGPYDVIMASTMPPVLTGAAARLAARLTGASFIYHCMDIHPEIGRLSGEFRHPFLFRVLQRIDAATCNGAARVIVLSRDMAGALNNRPSRRGVDVRVINNFNLPSFSDVGDVDPPGEMAKPAGCFRLLFAGNIGRFQGLESLVDAMHRLTGRPEIELAFLGEGRALEGIKSRAGGLLGRQIKFFPHQSVEIARAVIRTADACVVTLVPEIIRYAYPSKTMTYLGEGRPLLVCVEAESELAEFVKREGVGLTVEPNDISALADAIVSLADDSRRLSDMAGRATQVGNEYFAQEHVLSIWSRLLEEIGAERKPI
ncbi:hypothetical protein CKO41_12670 [Thiococcus pfennigii]|nr:hypothetical protein [Thiococcus pfennigii]MBK1732625.1 hypothetical protein [Thiococcus pfennigii]